MAKNATALRVTEEPVSKKPKVAPKKVPAGKQTVESEKVEHHHSPLPVLKPAKPLDIKTLRERLLEAGVKFKQSDDADTLKAKLDSVLAKAAGEIEDDLLDDENDCYGKPDMRMTTDEDCKRCPDFVKCGAAVAKVLEARKDLGDIIDSTDAAAEAAEIEEQEVPRGKTKARETRELPETVRPDDIKEVSDEYVLVYDDKPSFDDDDSPKIREAVNFIYQHKPETMAAFRKIVVLGYLRKPKSQADEVTVGLIEKLASGGFFRIQKKKA